MGSWVRPCQPGTLSRQRNSCNSRGWHKHVFSQKMAVLKMVKGWADSEPSSPVKIKDLMTQDFVGPLTF